MGSSDVLDRLRQANALVSALGPATVQGRVVAATAASAEVNGLGGLLSVGDRLVLQRRDGSAVTAETVGFRGDHARVMAFEAMDGVGPGSPATIAIDVRRAPTRPVLTPCAAWLGRVIDPLGRPLDSLGVLPRGDCGRAVRADPPAATSRARLGDRLDLGVTALNLFATCRAGQRLGLFAGSGVGKSTLLAMLARNTACDVAVAWAPVARPFASIRRWGWSSSTSGTTRAR